MFSKLRYTFPLFLRDVNKGIHSSDQLVWACSRLGVSINNVNLHNAIILENNA